MFSGKTKSYIFISILIILLILLNYRSFAQNTKPNIPMLGEKAPGFTAKTTRGIINFPRDYKGKWVVFFSHPSDFTPVCTTELMTFATAFDEFKKLNAELLGLSGDSVSSHIAWLNTIKKKIKYKNMENVEINFPVIADSDMSIAKKYGMMQPEVSNVYTVRAVFVINPEGIIKSIIYYPPAVGRNVDEIKRLIRALQVSKEYNVAVPANWQPGDNVIIPPYGTYEKAQEKLQRANFTDWFMCFKKLDEVKPGKIRD